MEDAIAISYLNDFIFCPVSIYFHNLYGNTDKMLYQSEYQMAGSAAHKAIDEKTYSTKKDILMSLDVYSEKYHIIGKIDSYNLKTKTLTERKKRIKQIYDGYVFQIYAQYFAMKEMGYDVKKLELYSMDDNKKYNILLPENNKKMFRRFEELVGQIRTFHMDEFQQDNVQKCKNCIYEPICDRSAR